MQIVRSFKRNTHLLSFKSLFGINCTLWNLYITDDSGRQQKRRVFNSLITLILWHISTLGIGSTSSWAFSGGLVGLRVPLLHDGEVEVLVGEEGGADDHGEADGEDGAHEAAVDDCVDAFSLPPFHLLLPVLVLVLKFKI